MYTAEELKEISYALISVELKSAANMDQRGYLLGFQPVVSQEYEVVSSDTIFIWMFRRGAVQMFDPEFYYVSDISVGFAKETSVLRMFKNDEANQKEAQEYIIAIMAALKEKQMVRINGLVDYKKYTNVPQEVKSAIELPSSSGIDKTASSASSYHVIIPERKTPLYGSGYITPYVAPIKKEVSTVSFKRTTDYNMAEALISMSVKITEIKEAIYKPPQLKHIPADDVAGEEKVTTNVTATDYYDEMHNYMGY